MGQHSHGSVLSGLMQYIGVSPTILLLCLVEILLIVFILIILTHEYKSQSS